MSDLTKKRVEETSPKDLVPERTLPKNCRACAYSGMEPSGPAKLICGHPDAGIFGVYLNFDLATVGGKRDFVVVPADHCGDHTKFEQHPQRTQDGDLK